MVLISEMLVGGREKAENFIIKVRTWKKSVRNRLFYGRMVDCKLHPYGQRQ
jgi:hypothetical protein